MDLTGRRMEPETMKALMKMDFSGGAEDKRRRTRDDPFLCRD
jgi:hypothetical protein